MKPAARTFSYGRFAVVLLILGLVALAFPAVAWAHVKWFASYDVTVRPKPFADVATRTFFALFAAFVTLLFLGFVADGWVAKRLPILRSAAGPATVDFHEKWVRLGTGAFLLCMWAIGLNILTPELHTKTAWVFTIQFLSAFFIAWKRTCVVSALGILVLYGYAINQYGMFHMLDYAYFLGLAIFLAGISVPRLAQVRVTAMIGALAFSIMWTAIEKFVYPQWTQQVLQRHREMAMGIHFDVFTVVAAFVEFTLAFYLATGRGMFRLGALILLVVFITAMPEFGRLDVVGHLPLVAMLAVPLMGGNSSLQRFWRLPGRGIVANAAAGCLLYTVCLVLFFVAYYGVQAWEYPPMHG